MSSSPFDRPGAVADPAAHLRMDGQIERVMEAQTPPRPQPVENGRVDHDLLRFVFIGLNIRFHGWLTFLFALVLKFADMGYLGICLHWNGACAATFAVLQHREFQIREQLVSSYSEDLLEFLGHARALERQILPQEHPSRSLHSQEAYEILISADDIYLEAVQEFFLQ